MATAIPTEANAPTYGYGTRTPAAPMPPSTQNRTPTAPAQTPSQQAATYSATGQYQTKDQAIAGLTSSMLLEFLNGNDANHPNGLTEPYWANSWWTAHGLQLPPSSAYGSVATGGATNPAQQQQLWDIFSRAAAARVQEDPTYSQLPSVPGSANPPPSPNQTSADTTSAANTAANNATELEKQRLADAAAAARQTAADAAALARTNIASGDSRYQTDTKAQTDRESIAATERIAGLDRTSKEGIATADRVERGREFDLQNAEDRRQFNATSLIGLLNTGVELAKNPVDWLGYQFYMQNMGIPVTALNLVTVPALLGAVPPSGPSAMGPVVGGPAVVDGDMGLATQLGIQNPGFVSVSQAVQQFPSGTLPEASNLTYLSTAQTYPQHVQQAGGAQQLDQLVSQARVQEVAPQVAPNPVIQQAVQQYVPQGMNGAPEDPINMAPNPAYQPGGTLNGAGGLGAISKFGPPPQPMPVTPEPPTPIGVAAGPGHGWAGPSVAPGTVQGGVATNGEVGIAAPDPHGGMWVQPNGSAGGWGTSMANPANAIPLPPTPLTPSPVTTQPVQASPTVTVGGNTGGGNTGIYTGAPVTTPILTTPTGGSAPAPTATTGNTQPAQGSDLLAQIANELGVPLATVQQLVPPQLLAGGYSKETIMQSPVIQSFINSNNVQPNYYRTADASGSKFGTIQMTGQQTGLRGGQDYNAQTYLGQDDPTRAMTEGAFNATGMSASNELKKAFRASPLSNYDQGSFGRRVA